jgi:epoxide hydrolase-like predicted phosphatase
MGSKPSPTGIKAVFFDIGGVCVRFPIPSYVLANRRIQVDSPMLAIASYEALHKIPSGYINYAISASAPSGAWQRLERNEMALDSQFFAEFARDIRKRSVWKRFHEEKGLQLLSYDNAPPRIDAESLFWDMMERGQKRVDVVMAAVQRLRDQGVRVGALTNDYPYPEGHPYAQGKNELRELFDVYVSSAETGMRKPERGIYLKAMEMVGLKEGEGAKVAFLDDIGANLKTARELGWNTVRVKIGETKKAVRELEEIVGLPLLEERSKL